ncbi:hypothetical protein Tco_0905071, partial [Tanacetum coccineum]
SMGFNESGEYKKTFIGSGVGTGSVQALQGVEEQHLAWELFSYREDNNESAFAVAAVATVAGNAVTIVMSITGSIHQGTVMWKRMASSHIYAVRSQEYQMVCTRLDIASADVDQSQAGYMTLTKAAKEAIGLKGLAIESGFELKIVAGIARGALSKAIPGPRFQHRLKLLHIEDF